MKELLVIYEREQIDQVLSYVRDRNDVAVVALDFWVGRELAGRGVPFLPLTDYVPNWKDLGALHAKTEHLAWHWHRVPEMSFFKHKGLALGEAFELMVSIFLGAIQGHLVFFERIFELHEGLECLVIPHSAGGIPEGAGPFAPYQITMMTTVGEFVARRKNASFKTIGTPPQGKLVPFPAMSFPKKLLISAYNGFIGLCAPRRALRLYVSDHWRNIKEVATALDDAEIIFVDRKEFKHIPLRALWKHRIRFLHPLDVLSKKTRTIARTKQDVFRTHWQKAKTAVARLPEFIHQDVAWWDLAEPALSFLVESYSERIVADIESIEKILTDKDIHRTLLRASISGQHHFFIMGELSRALNLSTVSVELQHGIGVGIFPQEWVAGHMHADYVASYGPFVQQGFVRNGYNAERVALTGSPRFDRYVAERDTFSKDARNRHIMALGLDPKRLVVVVVMTNESPALSLGPSCFNSYEFRDIIVSLSFIQRALPEAQFILKFRSEGDFTKYQSFVEEAFVSGTVAISFADAFSTIMLADFVYCCFTTVAGEVLMARKPMILFPLEKGDDYFYEFFKRGAEMTAFPTEGKDIPIEEVVHISQKLMHDPRFYAEAVQRGGQFLAESYTFKGDSADRVAEFLRTMLVTPTVQP